MARVKNPSKYSYISYETRLQIVDHVCNEGLTIKKTAEILGLKPSTARMILKRFKEDGVIFERKAERHKRTVEDNLKVEDNMAESEEKKAEQNWKSDYLTWSTIAYEPNAYMQCFYIPINYWSIPHGFC